ncbi:YhfX family PLP-dependent enzyme [Abyssisolibacter fermentans]|uniref:YhfX family PLP-dependent enzyme n=1 Tax=Abyssisolibacter fermentans TaxID=1766203 RepID=UPI00083472BE|nr:YhfX family PLP-dependent enzyme [Abyssisolibacter fermentans]
MFLESTITRNRELIETAFSFHTEGKIEPNTYLLDLDNILKNARAIKEKADKLGIDLFFMTKQIGRNPYVAKKLMELGYKGAVVVDFEEAQVMMKNNIPICNVGHLVQIPSRLVKKIVSYGVDFITVYSIEKLREVNAAAKELNIKQKIMIRVLNSNHVIYPGQAGGFYKDDIKKIVEELKSLDHVELVGLTTFPCFLYDEKEKKVKATRNVGSLKEIQEEFKNNNINISELNMPSVTCIQTLDLINELGGTQGEPGHALTGTTPDVNGVEIPSMVYVSEISHNFQGQAYCFGGGYYRRGHLEDALVGKTMDSSKKVKAIAPTPESIDYHIAISEECQVGDTVIMVFRTQIFVTRSKVAIVEGLSQGKPIISSIYNSLGELIKEY